MIPFPTMLAADSANAAPAIGLSILEIGSTVNSGFATSITMTQPSGVKSGDVGILIFDGTGTSVPAGWTRVVTNSQAFYKVYGTNEGSFNITAGSSTALFGLLAVYRNVYNASPFSAVSTTKIVASGTSCGSNAATALHPRTLNLCVSRVDVGSGTPTVTEPVGYTAVRKISYNIFGAGISKLAGIANGASTGTPAWTSSIATFDARQNNILLRPSDT